MKDIRELSQQYLDGAITFDEYWQKLELYIRQGNLDVAFAEALIIGV